MPKTNYIEALRARPKEHFRSDSITSKGYRSPTIVNKGFKQAVTLDRMGVKELRHGNHTYYEYGEGLFTKAQLLRARQKHYQIKEGVKIKKEDVGL